MALASSPGNIRSWNAAHDGPIPLSASPAKPPKPHFTLPPPPDREFIIARLEEAGAAMLALQVRGTHPAGLRAAWPEVVRQFSEAYGYSDSVLRPPVPTAARISRMDEALGWIELIPGDKFVLKRIVGARSLVSPLTGKNLYSWSRLAKLLHADRRAVTRWYEEGVKLICLALAQKAAANLPRANRMGRILA